MASVIKHARWLFCLLTVKFFFLCYIKTYTNVSPHPFLFHSFWWSCLWAYCDYSSLSCFPGDKDGSKVTTVVATPGQGPDRPQEVSYTDTKVIGNGSFGVVYQAKLCDSGELVAIKKVLQDKRFKVRVCIASEYSLWMLSCFPFFFFMAVFFIQVFFYLSSLEHVNKKNPRLKIKQMLFDKGV